KFICKEVEPLARKKRKRKRRTKAAKALQYELFGLLFIFLSIFGSGASLISEGFIPTGLENAFRFFLGIWYFVASIIFFIFFLYLFCCFYYSLYHWYLFCSKKKTYTFIYEAFCRIFPIIFRYLTVYTYSDI